MFQGSTYNKDDILKCLARDEIVFDNVVWSTTCTFDGQVVTTLSLQFIDVPAPRGHRNRPEPEPKYRPDEILSRFVKPL